MSKDFDIWNSLKKNLNVEKSVRYAHEGDVWWCSVGLNIGYEQDGSGDKFQRPVLVLKRFSLDTYLIVPLTTSLHRNKFRIPIVLIDNKQNSVIISQMKIIDRRRLIRKVCHITPVMLNQIKKTVKDLL